MRENACPQRCCSPGAERPGHEGALAIATFAWGEPLAITAVASGAAILTAAYLVGPGGTSR